MKTAAILWTGGKDSALAMLAVRDRLEDLLLGHVVTGWGVVLHRNLSTLWDWMTP